MWLMHKKSLNIKYIRLITMTGLFCVVVMQALWVYNAFTLSREIISSRFDDLFGESVVCDMFYRIELSEDNNSFRIEVETNFGEETGVYADKFSQRFWPHLQTSIQESLSRDNSLPVSLSVIDSIYSSRLASAGIDAEAICCITDSLGNILSSSRDFDYDKNKFIKTSAHPINRRNTENLQAFIANPYGIIFRRMILVIVSTVVLLSLIVYCLIRQIRVISRQKEIARVREDFSYAMIHDMKTPITSILMGARILESGKLDGKPEKKGKYFQIMKDEAEHLLSLANKVLTISKLENRQLKLEKETIALKPMLDDLAEKFSAKSGKSVSFKFNLDAETVFADEEFFKEAISNLIDNSVKYSGETVHIEISSCNDSEGDCKITVHDDGFGIPLRDQTRIFEKYERAYTSGKTSGFGLGLNYVLRVVEAHGGKVRVESIEGEYSEFTITLPKAQEISVPQKKIVNSK